MPLKKGHYLSCILPCQNKQIDKKEKNEKVDDIKDIQQNERKTERIKEKENCFSSKK